MMMGTNYYQVIDCCDKCGRGKQKVHIGKSSGGWPFVVHIIPESGINNWQDWYARLKNGAIIKDEYGDQISLSDLDSLVKAKRFHKDDLHVLESYLQYPNVRKRCAETGDTLSVGEFS